MSAVFPCAYVLVWTKASDPLPPPRIRILISSKSTQCLSHAIDIRIRRGDEREGQEEGAGGEEAGEAGRRRGGREREEEAQGRSQGEPEDTRMHQV